MITPDNDLFKLIDVFIFGTWVVILGISTLKNMYQPY